MKNNNKNLLTFKKALNTVSESLVYKNKTYKPKISLNSNTIKFSVQLHEAVNNRTKQKLQEKYTPVYKKIFEAVRQELVDKKAPYTVGFTLKENNLKISKVTAGGVNAKLNVIYEQVWNVEFIGKSNVNATF